jgi:hypothetical protein
MDWLSQLHAPTNAIAVLTAMITPALLMSACGALIMSTANRMGRVIDRLRFISARYEELVRNPQGDDLAAERLPLLDEQIQQQVARARLMQRSLVAFYSAVGVFVATSLTIAVTTSVATNYSWTALALGLLGAVFMLYGSVLMIAESRRALAVVASEVAFLAKVDRHYRDRRA